MATPTPEVIQWLLDHGYDLETIQQMAGGTGPTPSPTTPAADDGWGGFFPGAGGDSSFPPTRMIGGIPFGLQQGPGGLSYAPIPMQSPYQQMLQRFGQFAGGLPFGLGSGIESVTGNLGNLLGPSFAYPGTGGGGGTQAFRYDPFSQELQAAQLQEQMRQFQFTQGLDRSKFLQQTLSTPSNIFSSFFQARGEVPPYNAQLANILNIPGQGSPWFGALPPMGPTPGMPTVPTPQPPQAIPYAKGGTYIPAEPAVAIGLDSGQPLFTFNEQAPAKTEKIKITPQKKGKALEGQYIPPAVPGFQAGGNVYTTGVPGVSRGATPTTATAAGTQFPGMPDPLADLFARDFPQFPYLRSLGRGEGLGFPQLSKALHGLPLPSPQFLNRMTPSEGENLMGLIDTIFGQNPADLLWASLLPFRNLRGAMPALQRRG